MMVEMHLKTKEMAWRPKDASEPYVLSGNVKMLIIAIFTELWPIYKNMRFHQLLLGPENKWR
jgi:hypothetical protein